MNVKVKVDELNRLNDKLRIYKNEEEVLVQDIKNSFLQIGYCYKNENANILDELNNSLVNKLIIINKNNYNNMHFIDKNINRYLEINQKVEKVFEDLLDE